MKAMTDRSIEHLSWALAAGGAAVAWPAVSPAFAGAIALGAAFEAANFRALRVASRHFFAGKVGGAGPWAALFGGRLVLLATGIALAVHLGVHPIGLVVGLSFVVPAALVVAWRSRPPVDPDALALAEDDPEWEAWNPWLARSVEAKAEDDAS